MKLPIRTIGGEKTWLLRSRDTELGLTQRGGHVWPLVFDRTGRAIEPLAAPQLPVLPRKRKDLQPILRILRGDFFCLPFGHDAPPYRGERHGLHGEVANQPWKLTHVSNHDGEHTAKFELRTRARPGRVVKEITLINGHPVAYFRHTIHGMAGPMTPGHHAMLLCTGKPGSAIYSTSPVMYARTSPVDFPNPDGAIRSTLAIDRAFASLRRAPTAAGGTVDLTRFPGAVGSENLAQIWHDPRTGVAWNAVTFPAQRYVWFAIKDPAVLSGTIFWYWNRGPLGPRFKGRPINVMAVEDVTTYTHLGLSGSVAPNAASRRGLKTVLRLRDDRPTIVNYIMGAVSIPRGFDRVARVVVKADGVVLVAASGKRVHVPVNLAWLCDHVIQSGSSRGLKATLREGTP